MCVRVRVFERPFATHEPGPKTMSTPESQPLRLRDPETL